MGNKIVIGKPVGKKVCVDDGAEVDESVNTRFAEIATSWTSATGLDRWNYCSHPNLRLLRKEALASLNFRSKPTICRGLISSISREVRFPYVATYNGAVSPGELVQDGEVVD